MKVMKCSCSELDFMCNFPFLIQYDSSIVNDIGLEITLYRFYLLLPGGLGCYKRNCFCSAVFG